MDENPYVKAMGELAVPSQNDPPFIPPIFRFTWFRLYRSALTGVCAAHEPGRIWNEEEVADDAASIADHALEQYRRRFGL